MPPSVLSNPEANCPPDILAEQVQIPVRHIDFKGAEKTGTIEMNQRVADDTAAFFIEALKRGFPFRHVTPASDPPYEWDDRWLMAANATSGFNYRTIAGTERVSLHGFGLAFDVNPRQNPYIRYEASGTIVEPKGALWQPDQPGTLFATHALVRFMKRRGWEWGGDWNPAEGPIDYQHFQKLI